MITGNGAGPVLFTDLGGVAILMINDTGAPTNKGYLVRPSGAVDNGVVLVAQDIPDVIGIFLNDGVPDGELARVVVSGIAEVYFTGNVTRDQLARGFVSADAGFVAGQALNEPFPTSPFANDKHFYEIGHTLESRVGAGLAKTNLHFN